MISPMSASSTPSADDNQVFLRGRLAAEPFVRTLPSGDELCAFRLTVARPPGERVSVDSLDCSTTKSRVRRTLERAAAGDEVEVQGSLHRRFWRSDAGLGSRYEVAVDTARLTARRRGARPQTDA
jgi:single-strand DNA-binding protein